jgi:hypothetical protein
MKPSIFLCFKGMSSSFSVNFLFRSWAIFFSYWLLVFFLMIYWVLRLQIIACCYSAVAHIFFHKFSMVSWVGFWWSLWSNLHFYLMVFELQVVIRKENFEGVSGSITLNTLSKLQKGIVPRTAWKPKMETWICSAECRFHNTASLLVRQ